MEEDRAVPSGPPDVEALLAESDEQANRPDSDETEQATEPVQAAETEQTTEAEQAGETEQTGDTEQAGESEQGGDTEQAANGNSNVKPSKRSKGAKTTLQSYLPFS